MKRPTLFLFSLIFCSSAISGYGSGFWRFSKEYLGGPGDDRFAALHGSRRICEPIRAVPFRRGTGEFRGIPRAGLRERRSAQDIRAFNKKANIYRLKEQYTLALELYDKAEQQAELLEIPRLKAIVLGNKVNVYFYQKEYNKAIRNYSDALVIFQEKPDPQGVARMFLSIGNVNSAIFNYDLALEYYDHALQAYLELEANDAIQSGIGVLYME